MSTRTIGRAELHSSESSRAPTPDPDVADSFRALLNKQFGAVEEVETLTLTNSTGLEVAGDDDEELEFRVFASQKDPARVAIRSPSPTSASAGFTVAERPKEYYFASEPYEERLDRLGAAAVSGEEILRRSQTRWAGCALPWKITVLGKGTKVPDLPRGARDIISRRRRPSKKCRIALRVKVKAKEAAAAEKEAYLREKKTAENRKKQQKRRAKEKAKKTGEAGGDETAFKAPDPQPG